MRPTGEGGDEHDAAPLGGARDHLGQDLGHVLGRVDPVAVGGLDHHVARRGRGGRGPHDGVVSPAEVAAEEHGRAALVEPHRRGPEDVAGRAEPGRDPAHRLELLVERMGPEAGQRRLGVGLRVERERRVVAGGPTQVGVAGVLLLEVGRVAQEDAGQRRGGRRAPDRSPEPVADQGGEVAAVVDVGVGEQHRLDRGRVHRERRPVQLPEALQALEEAAVDEQPAPAGVDEEPGAGDGLRCAEEGELHDLSMRGRGRDGQGRRSRPGRASPHDRAVRRAW